MTPAHSRQSHRAALAAGFPGLAAGIEAAHFWLFGEELRPDAESRPDDREERTP